MFIAVSKAVARIGTMARFDPVKGLETIIEAAALLKDRFGDIKTFLIGDGPQRAQLEQMTLNLGLEGDIVVTGRRRAEQFTLNGMIEGTISVYEAVVGDL